MAKLKPYELDLSPYALPLNLFGRQGDTLVAEASTLGNPANLPLFNDACDVGIAIRSHHTDRVVRYHLAKVDKDREGDIAGWRYEVVQNDAAGVKTPKVLIIND